MIMTDSLNNLLFVIYVYDDVMNTNRWQGQAKYRYTRRTAPGDVVITGGDWTGMVRQWKGWENSLWAREEPILWKQLISLMMLERCTCAHFALSLALEEPPNYDYNPVRCAGNERKISSHELSALQWAYTTIALHSYNLSTQNGKRLVISAKTSLRLEIGVK